MTIVQIPASLGGTNTPYNDGTGLYGMASNNGYGYQTVMFPMLLEVAAACAITVASAQQVQQLQSQFNRLYLGAP